MPPKITSAVKAATAIPINAGEIFRFSLHTVAIALTWVAHPIPKEANPPKKAKSSASHFICNPRSSAYIAPPCIRPSFVLTRYLTAIRDSLYLVAMPKTPVSQHQRTAPGPPSAIAVPTPMIFPVPIVEASAVVSAPNWLTSPSASVSLVTDKRIAVPIFLWITPVRIVMKMCVPSSRRIIHQPHTRLSSLLMKFAIVLIIDALLWYTLFYKNATDARTCLK